MKKIRMGWVCVIMCAVLSVAGCATMRKKESPETLALKNQISELQNQLQQKDSEIDSLRRALSRSTEEKYAVSKETHHAEESSTVPSVIQIQTALCNAGYAIEIDGKPGRQTRAAIRIFRKPTAWQ